MKKILSAFMALIMLMTSFTVANITAIADESMKSYNVKVRFNQTEARKMLDQINSFRTGNETWYWNESNTQKNQVTGLKPLTYNYQLERIAMQRAAEIAINFSHYRPNGNPCHTLLEYAGIDYKSCGENIAYGINSFFDSTQVFIAWKEDDNDYKGQGHRRNMLSAQYDSVGVGFACVGEYTFWVQEFGSFYTMNDSYTLPNDYDAVVAVDVLTGYKLIESHINDSGFITTEAPTFFITQNEFNAKTNNNVNNSNTDNNIVNNNQNNNNTVSNNSSVASKSKPKSTKITKAKGTRKMITAYWKKVTSADGYQIQIATDKSFKKNKKTITKKGSKSSSVKIKSLKSKKKYYVRIRTYKYQKINGKNKKIYSDWSKSVSAKTK